MTMAYKIQGPVAYENTNTATEGCTAERTVQQGRSEKHGGQIPPTGLNLGGYVRKKGCGHAS